MTMMTTTSIFLIVGEVADELQNTVPIRGTVFLIDISNIYYIVRKVVTYNYGQQNL